jgi:hypothetical protein
METKPSVTIADDAWRKSGPESDAACRLNFSFDVNGTPMHLEAWAVVYRNGLQEAADPEHSDFDALLKISDERFATTMINGREYVLVSFPIAD